MIKFTHFNFNVLSIEKSVEFYNKALGLIVKKTIEEEGFKIVYLGFKDSEFTLELTEIFGRTEAYDLGEEEFHLAFETDKFDKFHQLHQAMDCICFENAAMGIYFIKDLDGYWIEILPEKN